MAIGPFFKENQCTCEKRTGPRARSVESMRCATEEYINCPIYRESVKKGRRVIADGGDRDPQASMRQLQERGEQDNKGLKE